MNITFRPVTMDDAEMLLGWKNEEDTRKNSIETDAIIMMPNHLVWLKNRLDRAGEFFIILLDGDPIGDVRLEYEEISIRMDKKYRGMGLATQVIAKFPEATEAKIRAHNIPSMRVFIANGFRPSEYIESPVPYYIFRK